MRQVFGASPYKYRMITEKLVNLNIDTLQFEKVLTPNIHRVINALRKYGFELRVVGGAVRDYIRGIPPRDVDFATDADPSELIYIFNQEGIPLNDNGIAHGTIKAEFGDETIDVTSIGYKLEVKDGKLRVIRGQDWEQDAQHRDLTINSMSVDKDGLLYDYVGGLKDSRNQTVRMNPITRTKLKDDPHLIMRWFKAIGNFDQPRWIREDYQAVKENMPLLASIAGQEKTDREISSILRSKHGQQVIKMMCSMGADKYLGINCD